MVDNVVVSAFSEEDASALSGVSRAQLRHWNKIGLLPASLGPHGKTGAYQRIYSFRDLVSLRVLNRLRNDFEVSLRHLKEVSEKLAHLGADKWTSAKLFVLGKRVVFDDPSTNERKEVVSGQRVLDIPLSAAISDTLEAIRNHNVRGDDKRGEIVSQRFVISNEPVFAGTRIPVSMVLSYIDSGWSDEDVLAEFPGLSDLDLDAARQWAASSSSVSTRAS